MLSRILVLWDALRGSYWFIPSLLTLASIGVAFVMISIDQRIPDEEVEDTFFLYTGGAEGARAVLSTIAGSVITIAGVVFSITITTLAMASQQFGPRLLRNFMNDRSNQFVLGVFVATFTYCLLVLRTIRGSDYGGFVPYVSVTAGVVLALVSVAFLIYFIHHMAISIQADHVVARVSHELHDAIDDLYPKELQRGQSDPDERVDPPEVDHDSARVTEGGYIQHLDTKALLRIAEEHDVFIRMLLRPGHYAIPSGVLAYVWPAGVLTKKLEHEINAAVIVNVQRTLLQDVEFGVEQLVEVAVRALSTGVNDPYTAISCIDRLTEAMCELCKKDFPPSVLRANTRDSKPRVLLRNANFTGVIEAAYNPIRQTSKGSVPVIIRMLESLTEVARCARNSEQLAAVQAQAELVKEEAAQARLLSKDKLDVEERYREFMRVVNESEGNNGSRSAAS